MTHQIKSLEEYKDAYQRSVDDPKKFWAEQAETFTWVKKWEDVLKWNFDEPNVRWFDGGQLNITVNCLDRHLADRGDQVALLWEGNDIDDESRSYTYRELYEAVCQMANALKAQGVKKGDRVIFYMPMVPELTIGLLACARIGAIHSVVFAGYSAQALASRVNGAEAVAIVCSDYNKRGAKTIPVKEVVDDAIKLGCPSVETVIVHHNTGGSISWDESRDVYWHDIVNHQAKECEPEIMDAEDTLFVLYTSGSTGMPKGVVHTCGGYMVYACYTFRNVFQYKDGDVHWCTADIGWITGHSYIVYGPLLAGGTTLMFEGVPTYPDAGRFWQVCEKHKVTQFYTAPTAIRALMARGDDWPAQYDLSSIKLLGSVGEPINEEAWHWYHEHVGKGKCPIIDTWWQTETGGILLSPIPGVTDCKPTFTSYPQPGVQPVLVDADGNVIEENEVDGLLCFKFPWPSMLRSTFGDHERCRRTYFSDFKGMYFSGDSARRDSDGRIRVIGRVDDVINVSGHRMGTAEVENAIDEHPQIIESAVVGYPHVIKGQGIFAYVIADNYSPDTFEKEIRDVVTKEIGPIAKPDKVLIVRGLPKTRSGKIMRRILRKIAAGEDNFGDISTLLNPEIVAEIQQNVKEMS